MPVPHLLKLILAFTIEFFYLVKKLCELKTGSGKVKTGSETSYQVRGEVRMWFGVAMGMKEKFQRVCSSGKKRALSTAVSAGTCETACCFFFLFLAKYTKILAKLVELTLEKPNFSKFYFANFFFEKWRKKKHWSFSLEVPYLRVCVPASVPFVSCAARMCRCGVRLCVFSFSFFSHCCCLSVCWPTRLRHSPLSVSQSGFKRKRWTR